MKGIIATLLAVSPLILGCATAPQQHIVDPTALIPSDYDRTWVAIIETFAELNLPITNMEKESGLITTDWISITGTSNADYADCGGLGLNDENFRDVKFNVFAKRADDGIVVRVTTSFRQGRSFGNNHSTVNCNSTGQFERKIHNAILSKVQTSQIQPPPATIPKAAHYPH